MIKRQQMEVDILDLRRQLTAGADSTSSEGRLRAAMTQSGVSTEELQAAIQGVEAMLGEAKRELQARQTRERRAAFEALHSAISSEDEGGLQAAINEAMHVNIEAEDIDKAVAKL